MFSAYEERSRALNAPATADGDFGKAGSGESGRERADTSTP